MEFVTTTTPARKKENELRVAKRKLEDANIALEKARRDEFDRRNGTVRLNIRGQYELFVGCMKGADCEATLVKWVNAVMMELVFNPVKRSNYRAFTYHIPDFKDNGFEYPDFITVYADKDGRNPNKWFCFSDAKDTIRPTTSVARFVNSSKFQYDMIRGRFDWNQLERLSNHPGDVALAMAVRDLMNVMDRKYVHNLEGLYFITYLYSKDGLPYGAAGKPLEFRANLPS